MRLPVALLVEADGVSQLLEKALRDLFRLPREAADLAQHGLLLGSEVLGNDHLDHDVLVAAPPASHVWHPLALQPERLAVLCAPRHCNLDMTHQSGDLDPVPEGRLDHVDAQLENNVLVVARKLSMLLDAQNDIEVPPGPAPEPRLSLAAEPYLRPGVDPRGDLDRQPC